MGRCGAVADRARAGSIARRQTGVLKDALSTRPTGGRIGRPDEAAQQTLETVGRLMRDRLGFRMARVAAGEACGIVGDDGDCGAAQARAARQDHLRHCRHADEIGAENARGANLGRRLEARPGKPHVDALVELDFFASRRFAERGDRDSRS